MGSPAPGRVPRLGRRPVVGVSMDIGRRSPGDQYGGQREGEGREADHSTGETYPGVPAPLPAGMPTFDR